MFLIKISVFELTLAFIYFLIDYDYQYASQATNLIRNSKEFKRELLKNK